MPLCLASARTKLRNQTQASQHFMHHALDLSWSLAAGTLCGCRGHQAATVLARNHNHFFNNHFSRRLNPSLLKRLVNLQEIDDNEDHRQTNNEEQRNKNNPHCIHGFVIRGNGIIGFMNYNSEPIVLFRLAYLVLASPIAPVGVA